MKKLLAAFLIIIILSALTFFIFFQRTKIEEPPINILEDIKKELLIDKTKDLWNEKAFGDFSIVYLGSKQISDKVWDSVFEYVIKGAPECFETVKLTFRINSAGYDSALDERQSLYPTTYDFYALKKNETDHLQITRDYECLEVKQPKCKIVYDNSHSQYNIDFVNPYTHKSLLKKNCNVELLGKGDQVSKDMLVNSLKDSDVYILSNIPQSDFDNEETGIIKNYVENGGVLIVFYSSLSNEAENSLLKAFGAEFMSDGERGYGSGKVIVSSDLYVSGNQLKSLRQTKDGKIEDISVLNLRLIESLL